MEPKLLYLVSDLMEDQGLRFEFNRDPKGIVDRYGLSQESRRVLFSMKRGKIFKAIKKEIDLWSFPDDGFPVDPRCSPAGVGAQYPSPVPIVRKIEPSAVAKSPSEANREWRAIQVFGQSFPPGVKPMVEDGANSLPVQRVVRRGTFRCSSIYFEVKAPATAGIYRVRLTWDDGGAKPKTIPKRRKLGFS